MTSSNLMRQQFLDKKAYSAEVACQAPQPDEPATLDAFAVAVLRHLSAGQRPSKHRLSSAALTDTLCQSQSDDDCTNQGNACCL